MDRVRLALVGCGGMGRALCDQARTLENAVISAVFDTDEERRAEAAERYEAVAAGSLDELLQRDDVDAVVVATPGGLHKPVVIAATAAGKHVFSEKPLAANVADADEMIRAVDAAGVKAMVGQVCRYHPTHRQLKRMVVDGPLGRIQSIYVERVGGGWGKNHPSWRLSRELSGGTLLEVNAHEIDFMTWLAGPVTRVMAVGGQMADERLDYPDVTWVSMTFASGAVGVLQSTNITTLGSYAGRFDAEGGSALVTQLFGGPITFKARAEGAEVETITPEPVENPVLAEMRAFVTAIIQDTEPPVTFAQARHTVAIAEAAYTSIETGEAVVIDAQETGCGCR